MVIGIAFSVKHDGEVRVEGVMPNSPAQNARRPPVVGDQLLRVNGQMIPALISKQELTILLADQCWKSTTLSLGFRADSWQEYTSVIYVQSTGSSHISRNLLSVLEEERSDSAREREGFPRLAHNLAPPVPLAKAPGPPAHSPLSPHNNLARPEHSNRRSPGSQPRQGGPADSAAPFPVVLRPGMNPPSFGTPPVNRRNISEAETVGWEDISPLHGGSFDPITIQEAWGGWEPGSSDKKRAKPLDATPTAIQPALFASTSSLTSNNGTIPWNVQPAGNGQSAWHRWRNSSIEARKGSMESWRSSQSGGSESRRDLRLGGTPSPPPSGDRSSRSAGSERMPSALRVLVDEMKEEVHAVRTLAEEKIRAAERGRAALEDELAALQDEAFERVQGMQEQLSSLKSAPTRPPRLDLPPRASSCILRAARPALVHGCHAPPSPCSSFPISSAFRPDFLFGRAQNLTLRLQLSRANQLITQNDDQPPPPPTPPSRAPPPAHPLFDAEPPAPSPNAPDAPAPLRPQQRTNPIYPSHFLSQSSFTVVAPPSSRLATTSDITWSSAAHTGVSPERAAVALPDPPRANEGGGAGGTQLSPDSEPLQLPLRLLEGPGPLHGGGPAQAPSDGSEESRSSQEGRTPLFAVTMEDGNELRIDGSTGRVVGQAPEDEEGLELL